MTRSTMEPFSLNDYPHRCYNPLTGEWILVSPHRTRHPYTQLLLSAVPDPSRGLRTADVTIRGEIPDLAALGTGCPFAARCPAVMDKCLQAVPPITIQADDRWVRCYLY